MFNVGFKDLIDKLEEYFGKAATKFAVGLLGVCLLLFAIGYAVSASVYPLALWVGAVVTGQPDVSSAISGFGTVASILWIVLVLALGVGLWRAKKDINTVTVLLADVQELQSDIEAAEDVTRKELDAMVERARELIGQASKAADNARETLDRAVADERLEEVENPPIASSDKTQ